MNLKKSYPYFFLIFFLPIFFINNLWDGSIISYGFSEKDLSGVKNWYFETSSNLQFYIIKILYIIHTNVPLSQNIIFDIFTLFALLLFSIEAKRYFERVFQLNKKLNNVCFILILTFPTWNFLTEINLVLYLICFYLALLGYRYFCLSNFLVKIFGIIIIFFSFSIKSNFAFVFALAFLDFLNNYFLREKKSYSILFQVFLLSIIGYFVNSIFFPPYGVYESYNQVNFSKIKILNIRAILDYLSFIIFYFLVPIITIIIFKLKSKKKIIFFQKNYLTKLISLFFFSGIALAPYYILDKSIDVFNFSDFSSRHVFSFCISIPFALVVTLQLFEKSISKKFTNFFIILFIVQNIVILNSSFFAKFNSNLINHNLTKNFKTLEEPKAGLILIINEKINRTFYNINFILYDAFNNTKWMSKMIKSHALIEQKIDIKNKYFADVKHVFDSSQYKKKYIATNFIEECLTIYKIENEITGFELIRRLYFLNQDKYFKLKKISERC